MNKAELDARADKLLAVIAGAWVVPGTAAAAEHAEMLAGALRAQFPGRDAETGRALTTVMSFLVALADGLEKHGVPAGTVTAAVLEVVGFTAGDLAGEGRRTRSAGAAPGSAEDPKAELDAHVDQVLADIMAAGPAPTKGAATAADNAGQLANALRVMLPGQDEKTARALALTVSFLGAFERDLEEHGWPPDLARMLAMSVLALTAGDLAGKGAGR